MSNAPLNDWLHELGEARSAGALARPAGRLPWEAGATPAKRTLRWARLAMPLTAAAAIAIAFVGPLGRTAGPSGMGSGSGHPMVAVAPTQAVDSSDCNRDGVVNGEDIACFVSASGREGSGLQAQDFTRRLLGI